MNERDVLLKGVFLTTEKAGEKKGVTQRIQPPCHSFFSSAFLCG